MAVQRNDPYKNFNFLVDLGTGDTEAGFTEVILPETWVDVIEYRTGNDKMSSTRKLPGQPHYGTVTLKRGVIGALDLYQWLNQIRNGDANAYRTVTIQLQKEDRTAVVLTWKFLRAWPSRYSFSPLEGKGKDVLIESLELSFDYLEME